MLRTEPRQKRIPPVDGEGAVIRFEVQGRIYTRGAEGQWFYGDTGVAVPGSRDLQLRDVYEPSSVSGRARSGDEFVMIAAADVACPELTWVSREGTPVEIAGRRHYLVAGLAWAQHGDAVCGVSAPELHGSPEERLVARAERDFRLAQHEAELAATRRARAFEIAAARGITRRRLAALVNLSPTRIQQLADDAPPAASGLAPGDDEAHWVLDAVARSPHVELAELQGADFRDQHSTVAAAQRLVAAGLITAARTADAFVLTESGREYVQHGRKVTRRAPAVAQGQS